MKKYVIGVDLGGTNIRAGLVLGSKLIKKVEVKTEPNKGKNAVIKNLIKAISSVMTKDVAGIGIGSPGPLDYKKGLIIITKNIPLKKVNLKKVLEKKFRVPVFVDNDANCFTLGEALYDSGKKHDCVIGLTIGTGVGGGIVINKKIFHGRMNAGELGHTSINFNGIKCNCGNIGCLEEYVSARGIMRLAKALRAKTPLDVYNLALKGNKKAISVFEKMGFYLGVGLTNFVNIFDPDIIVIGGKISNAWKFFSKSMKKTIKEKAYVNKNPIIVKSKLKYAAILGAASLVKV
ncbi:MAG: ROK family protein [Nanoarchaeota archaeon]|nr:ROK family protein [Nanoarchaeota archaeon]MBU4493369.1 ROK family protein [Nanoarchaeota archaeon]